ncbi:MAG: GntR family transcriptional regulator, partial [Burkholderiales bacterium]
MSTSGRDTRDERSTRRWPVPHEGAFGARESAQPTSPHASSRVEATYQRLRAQILDNTLPPGFRALEQELADRLGISRTPVREALIRLEKEGLVEVIPRHGMQ